MLRLRGREERIDPEVGQYGILVFAQFAQAVALPQEGLGMQGDLIGIGGGNHLVEQGQSLGGHLPRQQHPRLPQLPFLLLGDFGGAVSSFARHRLVKLQGVVELAIDQLEPGELHLGFHFAIFPRCAAIGFKRAGRLRQIFLGQVEFSQQVDRLEVAVVVAPFELLQQLDRRGKLRGIGQRQLGGGPGDAKLEIRFGCGIGRFGPADRLLVSVDRLGIATGVVVTAGQSSFGSLSRPGDGDHIVGGDVQRLFFGSLGLHHDLGLRDLGDIARDVLATATDNGLRTTGQRTVQRWTNHPVKHTQKGRETNSSNRLHGDRPGEERGVARKKR